MAFANTSWSDVITTTIDNRSGVLADNVTNGNALLARLSERGNIKPISGGVTIVKEMAFASNGNAMWYSGSENLNISPADVISAAQYPIKQAACAVTYNGLEELQNSSEEQIIDLIEGRIQVGEMSMRNLITTGLYSDGTGSNGKIITGLQSQVVASPATGIVGGINRADYTFWRNQTFDFSTALSASASATNIAVGFNTLWASCTRGADSPDLIMLDNNLWGFFTAALQNLQRFPTSSKMAELGFTATKHLTADVVLDGGIGGNVPTGTGYFLNTNYLFYQPHRKRNFVAIGPDRQSTNQDASVHLIGWAGNLTSNGLRYQGWIGE